MVFILRRGQETQDGGGRCPLIRPRQNERYSPAQFHKGWFEQSFVNFTITFI